MTTICRPAKSKKRFCTNAPLEPDFFTDRDLGKQFPAILAGAGLQVERHHDLFTPDGPDEQWLEYCGVNGRIAITHDQRIRHRPNERAAVIAHGVALLVVIGKLPYPELARHFVATLPDGAHDPEAWRVTCAVVHAVAGLTLFTAMAGDSSREGEGPKPMFGSSSTSAESRGLIVRNAPLSGPGRPGVG